MKLKIKALSDKIGKEIPLPYYATQGAAALDLHACLDEPMTIPARGQAMVPTGIAAAIPTGYVGILAIRSSMGVIDSDYRGPLSVALYNLNQTPYIVQPGDRIAQLMVVPVVRESIEVVDELPPTSRGEGGFGSTGR